MISKISLILSFFLVLNSSAQDCYWQQKIKYEMDVKMDVINNTFSAVQNVVYFNESPDTLNSVYFHLYFNAFQKGSMMDARSRTIEDPDRRVGDRINSLDSKTEGYQKVNSLKQDGKSLSYEIVGTILEVNLNKPIYPGDSTVFLMNYDAQVPLQVRRSGRDNKEGIRYSMTQWYPKMVEYDKKGWNANPYVGREFHGVWGDFKVNITIDSEYVLGATGYLMNKQEVMGATESVEIAEGTEVKESKEYTWKYHAPMVHDFAWVADPNYTHKSITTEDGLELNFLYQKDSTTLFWDSLPKYTEKIFEIMNANFGKYPYKQYTVAQGGDGGMEYPMITLVTGNRSKGSLVGVTAHEAIHSWYQHLLATNEALYPWMDEGFTSYATDYVIARIFPSNVPFKRSYRSYFSLVKSGKQEVLSTHADHYNTNRAYGVASYSMGLIFLNQLDYIMGNEVFMKGIRRYFNEWKYKHPTPMDFIRVMEKESSIELKWYLKEWTETTNTIDYSIKWITEEDKSTAVTLERIGNIPMPIDVAVKLKNGETEYFTIPLRIMRSAKKEDPLCGEMNIQEDWPWTFPEYKLSLPFELDDIESIEIDPSQRMADIDRTNNIFPKESVKYIPKSQ